MRLKTESGNVVSSHSSACGASSLVAKLRIDSRSCSCSWLKMKCLREEAKSGLRTSAVALMRARVDSGTSYFQRERTSALGRALQIFGPAVDGAERCAVSP